MYDIAKCNLNRLYLLYQTTESTKLIVLKMMEIKIVEDILLGFQPNAKEYMTALSVSFSKDYTVISVNFSLAPFNEFYCILYHD